MAEKETKKPEAAATVAPKASSPSQPTITPTQSAPLQIMDGPAPKSSSEPPKTATEPPKTAKAAPPKPNTEPKRPTKTESTKTNTEPQKAKTDSFEKPKKTEFKYKEDRKEALNALGLDENASEADIKKAYRKEALKHHPDRKGDTAKFQQVGSAYEYLTDTKPKPSDPNAHTPPPAPPKPASPPRRTMQPSGAPPASSFKQKPSHSYASQHTSNTSFRSQNSSHRDHTQPPRTQMPRRQQPTKLSPMAQTPQPVRHGNTSHHNLAVLQRNNDEKINRVLNNNHFSSPPQRIREPGKPNEKIAFGNAKDAITFASAAAKEGVQFQIKDSKSNILAYSNGDGKLYTGKHSEYKPGQKLDPVSPQNFQTPRSPQLGM